MANTIGFTPFNISFKPNWENRCFIDKEDEYITISNGNEPSGFAVNFSERTIEIVRKKHCRTKNDLCLFLTNLVSDLSMDVWQEWYDDLCLPGKTEVIHTKTGMRSTRYRDLLPEDLHISYNGDKGCDISSLNVKEILDAKQPVVIDYVKDAYFDYYALVIYYYRNQENKVTYFRPKSITKDAIEEFPEYYAIDLVHDLTFDVPDKFVNPYLVFSKTPNSKRVLITDGERNAGRLLAYSKFGNAMMYLPCGMNVFEDYYYMPLLWRKIIVTNVTNEGQKLLFKDAREKAFTMQQFLLDILNGIVKQPGKKGKKR